MKKFNPKSFVLGVVVTALVFTMALPALSSVVDTISARLNGVNLIVKGTRVASVGDSFVLDNGDVVPFSIVHRGTTYLPLRKLAEFIGVEVGWDGNTATVTLSEPSAPTTTPPPASSTETVSQRNAVQKAKDYLRFMAFSRSGLIKQLEYEGFSNADATYGADNSGANWNDQAVKKAQEYLDFMAFSRQGLIDQLIFEGFTRDQAVHGVNATGL